MYFGYVDGAIKSKTNSGAGMGFVAYYKDKRVEERGKHSDNIYTSFQAEAEALFFGLEIAIENGLKPLTIFNDCITDNSLRTNGLAERFENYIFKLDGKVTYIQHTRNGKHSVHNKRYGEADKIARYYRDIKKPYEERIEPRKVAQLDYEE